MSHSIVSPIVESSSAVENLPAYDSTTYCMGYWLVAENAKRPIDHYIALIPKTVEMLAGRRLVLFTDNSTISQFVSQCCLLHKVDLMCSVRSVFELPALEFARGIVHQTECYGRDRPVPVDFQKEKGLLHYWRDFMGSGPHAYQRILAIWLSKVFLVHEIAQRNPFESSQFAWVDATVARFNTRRSNWNFVTLANRSETICHYGSRMRKLGQPLSLNASFLKGDQAAWSSLLKLYVSELACAVREQYPNDEETILHNVKAAHPQMFLSVDLTG